ncbi:MAG: hypothetical protein R3250_04975, partial [Melioribacteraceae bacterium]|nr:hypothetical protein [Melioribacteraceae bacterium]
MNKVIKITAILLISKILLAQNLTEDFLVNSSENNTQGLGRTSIAAHSDGTFAIGWQDYNEYNSPIAEIPRIAVQMFSSTGNRIGQTNLFQGENRSLSIWLSDYLDVNSDLAFLPDKTLLVAVEHEGRLSIGNDDVSSSEVGIGAVNSSGELIDISNEEGIIEWYISTETKWLEHPRISVGKNGNFILTADGATYSTNNRGVIAQVFDSNGNLSGGMFTPHFNDLGPQVNHRDPDVATNGEISMIVWQDGSNGSDWDISAQFFNSSGFLGNNMPVHSNDPAGTVNVLPSVDMNANGESVIVWLDTRDNPNGEVFAQLYNSNGQKVGDNIKVSNNSVNILDRPEVAILNNGSFMVVWSDNITNSSDISGYRALGRQYDLNGNPITDILVIPNDDVASGFINIASDGFDYYCSWLDNRMNTPYLNVYAKKILSLSTDIKNKENDIPNEYLLMQNYPNPFNPSTIIQYTIPMLSNDSVSEQQVILRIYDILG